MDHLRTEMNFREEVEWAMEKSDREEREKQRFLALGRAENKIPEQGEPSEEAPLEPLLQLQPEPDKEENPHITNLPPQVRCLNYCSLFPENHEFDKNDLIQLWLAEGFLQEEDTASCYFHGFLSESLFLFSGFHRFTGLPRYKLNTPHYKHHSILYIKVEDPRDLIFVSKNTLHLSMHCDAIEQLNRLASDRLQTLSTLLLRNETLSPTERVPWDLFLKLPSLRVLDLSHSNINDLPITVGNLKELRYLDLSATRLTSLPDSLCTLSQLQTLKLGDCLQLVDLPRGIRKLFNLRHLEVDIASLLNTMPPGLGGLVQLRTLPAFVVGQDEGCDISELKSMVNLKGNLSIIRLENVSNLNQAWEATLDEKKHLDELELQWTELQDGLELLESLRPHTNLKQLRIVGYGGAKFPSWIGDPVFSKLVTISLHDCKKCELLPPLGKLPLLSHLSITKMSVVKTIDGHLFGRENVSGFLHLGRLALGKVTHPFRKYSTVKAFPSLESLKFQGMLDLERWTGLEEGDLPSLQKLSISSCSKLVALPELSLLKSLKELEISQCPLLQSVPSKGLPISLDSLHIIDCSLLKRKCRKEEGEDWLKIAHIPNVWIDYQPIFQ